MRLDRCYAFNRQDRSHWNDDEKEKLFKWNIERTIDAKHSISIEKPVALRNRVGIPHKEKFVKDFVAAWTKVMNADRFDLSK